jgi:hypothetical protein
LQRGAGNRRRRPRTPYGTSGERLMTICTICGRERSEKDCKIIRPTRQELEAFRSQGVIPKEEYAYCYPCWRTLSDPTTGPMFAKGLLQVGLKQLGVVNCEKAATKYHTNLVKKIRERQQNQ